MQYLPALRRFAWSYARAACEGLLQDIALALWTAFPRFRGDSSQRTWVYRVAHNTAISFVTQQRRRTAREDGGRPPSEPASSASPEQEAIDAQRRECLRADGRTYRDALLERFERQIRLLRRVRCWLTLARTPPFDFRGDVSHDRGMLELLMVIGRALALALRGHRELVLENLALRQQLTAVKRMTKRPHLQTRDRLFWIALARRWRNWRTAVVLVQPGTVVRWHRDWLRRRWTRRSKARRVGRSPIDPQIRALVREMATANALWGAPRIHGELRTLGVDVSERPVSRLLERHPRPPSQTWKTFLTNHLASAASMDFFTVPTLTGRVLFVLVLLSHAA